MKVTKDDQNDKLIIKEKSPDKSKMIAMKKNFVNVKNSNDPQYSKNWAENMNKEIDSKASRHHDLIQEKQMKDQIKKREETKKDIKNKKLQLEEAKKSNKNLLNREESNLSPVDLNNNVSNLKKMKKKQSEPKFPEREQNLSTDTANVLEEKEVYQTNLKEMIDKLEDLKNKTNEWQKNNDSIVDQDDKQMKKKRLEKEKSKEHSDNLLKSKKDKKITGQTYKQSTDNLGQSQSNGSKSNSPDIKTKSKNKEQSNPDLHHSLASDTQMIYSENDEIDQDTSEIYNQNGKDSAMNKNEQKLVEKSQNNGNIMKGRPISAQSNKSNVSNSRIMNKKLEKSLNANIKELTYENLYEQNLVTKSFSAKQMETIKKVLNDNNTRNRNKEKNNNQIPESEKAVNSEQERSLAKEIKDLRSAIKILETQKAQILKDSDEINKCIGQLSSNPEITESLLLSQMEQNRPAQCEMLNKQVNEILVSPQIISLRENIVKMTQEVEMYESLLASFIQNQDPEKIAEQNELVQKCAEYENQIKNEENTPIISSYLKNYDSKIKQNVFKKVVKIEILNKAVDKFENEIESYKTKSSDIDHNIKLYSEKIVLKNKEIDELLRQKNSLMEKIDELKAGVKLKNILAEIEQLHEKIKEQDENIADLQSKYDEKKNLYEFRSDTNEHYADTLKTMNEDFQDRKSNQVQTISLYEEKIAIYKNKFETLNLNYKEKCIKLQEKIDDLNNQICKEKEHRSIQTVHDKKHVDLMQDKFKKHFESTDQQIYKEIKNLKFRDVGEQKSAFIQGFKMEAILKGWDGKALEFQIADQLCRFMKKIDHPQHQSSVNVSIQQMENAFLQIDLFNFCKDSFPQVWEKGLKQQLFKTKTTLPLDRLIHKLLKFVELENKPLQWNSDVESKVMSKLQQELNQKINELQSKIKSASESSNDYIKRKSWEGLTEQYDCILSMKQCEYLEIRAYDQAKNTLNQPFKVAYDNFYQSFICGNENRQAFKDWKQLLGKNDNNSKNNNSLNENYSDDEL